MSAVPQVRRVRLFGEVYQGALLECITRVYHAVDVEASVTRGVPRWTLL